MKEFKFYRREEAYGQTWRIDLPEYVKAGGNPLELQMIAGVDDFLDTLSEDNKEIKLQISEQKAKGFYLLKRVDEIPTISGRYYMDDQSDLLMWLGPIIQWIFEGRYPENMYYKLITTNKNYEVDPGHHNPPPRNSASNPTSSSDGGLDDLQAAFFTAPNV